jgi:hypothetical protein
VHASAENAVRVLVKSGYLRKRWRRFQVRLQLKTLPTRKFQYYGTLITFLDSVFTIELGLTYVHHE